MNRKLLVLVPCLALLMALGLAAGGTAQTKPARVTVFPSPGTHFARPGTAIAFRGVAPAALGRITLAGSKSGPHSFKVLGHSDGKGASVIPEKPFLRGETIGVGSDLSVRGRRRATSASASRARATRSGSRRCASCQTAARASRPSTPGPTCGPRGSR